VIKADPNITHLYISHDTPLINTFILWLSYLGYEEPHCS